MEFMYNYGDIKIVKLFILKKKIINEGINILKLI
jgi:hypothetical protein